MNQDRFGFYEKDGKPELPPAASRTVELYPNREMFTNVDDNFVFNAHGRHVYTMSYAEAYALSRIGDKITQIQVLRAFRKLDLRTAKDIIEFLIANFKPR